MPAQSELKEYLMEWFHACINPATITSRYKTVPPLDPFPIYDCQLDPGLPSFTICGYLPRLPDNPDLPEGQIPERADLCMWFLDLTEFHLSGIPDRRGGKLQIIKQHSADIRFEYESDAFKLAGVCDRVVIGGVRVSAKHDPNHPEPRGPRLFSHHNVWNSCLLLLREFGYSLRASGHSAHRDYPTRWRWYAALPNNTELSADSPIELLGLAALHRYHNPDFDAPYWWRIDGPSVANELIDQWCQQSDPTTQGDSNAG